MLNAYLVLPTVYCKSFKVKGFVIADINCNSLENIHGWMVVLHDQGLLHRLLHWKSFTVADQSAKTAKLFCLEGFAIYGSCITR